MNSTTNDQPHSRLSRRLNFSDAVFLGLGSMIGAGVFSAMGPATQVAGYGILWALVFAGLIAFMNASTMAQLAAFIPESGGTYAYGRRQLSDTWGFLAGWGFIIGKIASCSAMALTFAHYAFPQAPQVAAPAVVLLLTLINNFGVKKTAFVTKLLTAIVIVTLVVISILLLSSRELNFTPLKEMSFSGNWLGIFEATGLLFFAFAGYARLATLGEEVIDPKKTIPRAIIAALLATLTLYFFIIGAVLLTTPIDLVAGQAAPLAAALNASKYSDLAFLVRIGAAIATLSVLLSLLAGIARTVFAMASNQELPNYLSHVHEKYKVPDRAELLIGLIVAFAAAFADLRLAIGFSSFAILVYYAIAHLCALKLKPAQRLYPRWFAWVGLASCLFIAFHMPKQSVVGGLLLFLIGFGIRALRLRRIKAS